MTLAPSEAGISIHISTERPDTLDLIRRNIEMLELDLLQHGFEDLDFAFGSDTSADQSQQADDSGDDPERTSEKPHETLQLNLTQNAPPHLSDRLDIRV